MSVKQEWCKEIPVLVPFWSQSVQPVRNKYVDPTSLKREPIISNRYIDDASHGAPYIVGVVISTSVGFFFYHVYCEKKRDDIIRKQAAARAKAKAEAEGVN